ncbi:hypothetical protein AbraIFM66950_006330 [Aspergillus brasiliensis]|nr:hypothetical protein AbraIFM66950_006330 [Aspergillus brasiliensis]
MQSQKHNTAARIAQLEGKLDELVSSLQPLRAQSTSNSSVGNSLSAPASDSNSPATSGEVHIIPGSTSSLGSLESSPEESLDVFRTHMLQYFPFLHLPNDVRWIRQERPFLFLCIMAVTCPSIPTKLALGEKIRRIATERMFLSSDPGVVNLDLLLGLLTVLAWGYDHLLHDTAMGLPRFTQLAITVVYELRLNKPLDDANVLTVGLGGCVSSRGPTRTLEEQRAVLACFVLSSIISTCLANIQPMQWTSHMEECLEALTQNGETPLDEVFTHQVRLHRIAREAEHIRSASTAVPAAFHLTALQRKVNEVKQSITPELRENSLFRASTYYTELSIHGLVLSKKQDVPDLQRLEGLHACLQTAKSALDSFFQLSSTDDYIGMSFPFFNYLARSILVVMTLSTMNDPIWDTNLVRSTVDVLWILDRLISEVQEAKASRGEESESANGFLDKSAKKLISLRASACAALMSEKTQRSAQAAAEDDLQLLSMFQAYELMDAGLMASFMEGTAIFDGFY